MWLNITGITKKWLSALKGDVFYEETLEYFLTAFRSLLNNTMTAETHRSIALHITYSVYKAKDKTGNLRHMKSNMRQAPPIFGPIIRRSTAPVTSLGMDGSDAPPPKTLNRSEVGVKMLGLYADILCQHDTSNIKKFARTVTNKVSSYIMRRVRLIFSVASLFTDRRRTVYRSFSYQNSRSSADSQRSAVC